MFYCLVVSTALHHPGPTLYSALSPPHQLSWLSTPLTLIHHPVSLICAVIAANIIHTPCIHFTLHTYSLSLHLSQTHTGCPKKNETTFLLNISATKYRIFKPFFSPENLDPYARFEYSNIFERFLGAEIFAKQNEILV